MTHSFYSASFSRFLSDSDEEILGILAHNNYFALEINQRNAWREEIAILKRNIANVNPNGRILFEYTIPRLGKRIDIVLLVGGIVFVLEFKVFSDNYLSGDRRQVMDYAIDLKGYHSGSREHLIIPILISTEAEEINNTFGLAENYIYNTIKSNGDNLFQIIDTIIHQNTGLDIDNSWYDNWETSRYMPTPTIIEAATSLYNNNDVREIANCESQENLQVTSEKVISIVRNTEHARNGKKAICFVTGVPGAGKTLVGLNVANAHRHQDRHAVYLSGNGPLVDVLTEALARNTEKTINSETDQLYTKGDAVKKVESFIQIVHHYRDATLKKLVSPRNDNNELQINPDYAPPHDERHGYAEVESVAIFDEAQRAWKREDLAKFLDDKSFPLSESAFFLWSMDLREDYAVVICLVGNGQEINHGEAGIKEWIRALVTDFPHWDIHLSHELINRELSYEHELLESLYRQSEERHNVYFDEDLHLKTSIRSLRSEKLAKFVDLLLEHNIEEARTLYADIKHRFPIVLTRSINDAKEWLRRKGSAENIAIWLESMHYNGTVKEWILDKCQQVTFIDYLKSKIPNSSSKKWIETYYPCGNNKAILINAANSRGGKCYDRIMNAINADIAIEYFKSVCPVVDIHSWIAKELPDCRDKERLLEEIPCDFRYGLIASSSAKRLKALGIEVKNERQVSVASWFLDPSDDIRSSNFLEEVVSEFVIQGLELDYAGVIWDGDFRSIDNKWEQYNFTGSTWTNKSDEREDYQLNAYRVLLTRARLGMVIVIPEGDHIHVDGTIDKTRLPEFYDCTYDYLRNVIGIEEI